MVIMGAAMARWIPDDPAINYRDMAAVDVALASPARAESRAATEAVLAPVFRGPHSPSRHDRQRVSPGEQLRQRHLGRGIGPAGGPRRNGSCPARTKF